jgi:hypothetical protein
MTIYRLSSISYQLCTMGLQGDLSEFPLTDLIQLVDLSKQTGSVYLQGKRGHERLEGWLTFRDGKIIDARLGDLPPLEAAYTLFTLTDGPFHFDDTVRAATQTITQSNEMIIMEGVMRQDAWANLQRYIPSLHIIPRLAPNPAATGSEINLEADEWRVLTMVNGKNTVAQIAQRSGLGELRTCEIMTQLLVNGLIEKRAVNLAEMLFPELEQIVTTAFGSSATVMLEEMYARVGITTYATATQAQVIAALDYFEATALRLFGVQRVRQPIADLRAHTQRVFESM